MAKPIICEAKPIVCFRKKTGTHGRKIRAAVMGFAALNPSYALQQDFDIAPS